MQGPAGERDWRAWLRRKIGILLLAKLAALILLKTLFFSGEQRPSVTPERINTHLAVSAAAAGETSRD